MAGPQNQHRNMFCFYQLMLATVITVFFGNSHTLAQGTSSAGKIQNARLGSTKNVHRLGDLFFAGQFAPDDLESIKANQITRIITTRTDGEIDWDEKSLVENGGIEFFEIPFRSPETLTDDVFDKTRDLLKDKSARTLFHCGSANRVAGVWLTYRVLDEKVDLEQAIAEAETIGLRTPFIKEKALDYIKRRQAALLTESEKTSVKPGINESFLDPNLKIEKFVDRFEVESREIYSAREKIVAACSIRSGQIVADVGSGTGLFTRMFSKSVGNSGWVFAVDISPRLVEHVTHDASKSDLNNISAVLCPQDSVSLPPDSVDVVFVCDTYHHFEYPESTMKSIYQALRLGGRLIVVDFERIPGVSRDWILGHVRAGKEVVRAEIQDAGFTLVEERKIDGLNENYFLVFRKNS